MLRPPPLTDPMAATLPLDAARCTTQVRAEDIPETALAQATAEGELRLVCTHTLARFVVAKRRQREFYDMVGVAVKSIGRLGIAQTDLLIAELESASPGVAVEAALGESLAAGRERLGWLVSRDVSALSETQVRESAIETLAENLSDGVLAPLFWGLVLGLPGVLAYKMVSAT